MKRDAWKPKVGTTSWRKRPELESGWCLTRDSYSIAVSLAFLFSLEFYIFKTCISRPPMFQRTNRLYPSPELLFLRKENIKRRRRNYNLLSFTSDNHSVWIILSYLPRSHHFSPLAAHRRPQNYIRDVPAISILNKIIVLLTVYFLLYPRYSPRFISLNLPQKILVSYLPSLTYVAFVATTKSCI